MTVAVMVALIVSSVLMIVLVEFALGGSHQGEDDQVVFYPASLPFGDRHGATLAPTVNACFAVSPHVAAVRVRWMGPVLELEAVVPLARVPRRAARRALEDKLHQAVASVARSRYRASIVLR